MRATTFLALLFAGQVGLAATPVAVAADCKSTVSGEFRLYPLQSRVFGNTRTIRVLLPDGYESPGSRDRRYPVLYMLDGQILFDACLSDVSHEEWALDETVIRPTTTRISASSSSRTPCTMRSRGRSACPAR